MFKIGFQAKPKGHTTKAEADRLALERAQRDLQALSKAMPKVAVRALNKAMTGTKTDMKGVIRENYNYKASALEKRLKVVRARRGSLSGYVRSSGGLYHLTDITGTRQTKKGVSVSVKKSTGRQLIPSAFIQPAQYSGKRIVLRRVYRSGGLVGRYPIEAKYAPHPEHLYNTKENWAKISRAASKRIDANIEREIDAEFRKYKGRW